MKKYIIAVCILSSLILSWYLIDESTKVEVSITIIDQQKRKEPKICFHIKPASQDDYDFDAQHCTKAGEPYVVKIKPGDYEFASFDFLINGYFNEDVTITRETTHLQFVKK